MTWSYPSAFSYQGVGQEVDLGSAGSEHFAIYELLLFGWLDVFGLDLCS